MEKPQDSLSSPPAFDYNKEKCRIDQLIGQWEEENTACKLRRDFRKKEVNITEERDKNHIAADEVIIPRRVIDRNIQLAKPEYISYLEQSPRTVLFKSLSNPTKDTIPLADWFTLGVRYQGWAESWHRVIDSCLLHGAGFIEVRYDKARPFNLALEYTPRECLIFPKKLRRSLQRCEMILRAYEYLPNELEDYVSAYGFNEKVVSQLVQSKKESNREEPIKVYKVFRKKQGVIYIGWYSPDAKEAGWLKDPEPMSFGIIDPQSNEVIPVTNFPFFTFVFEFTEEEEILSCKGRAARDLADQDALTQIWSAIVNGTNRAATVNASFEADPTNPEGQSTQPIERNVILSKPANFWQADYPDPFILTVAQSLSTENLQSSGKVDYAAQNRQDSRKTATEIQAATRQSSQLSTVNVVPFATCITEVYTFLWNLVQQQVIYSLANPEAPLIPIPEHIPVEDWTDNYELAPAGDVEVLKRAEKISNLQQDMALFQGTPVYLDLVAKYLELRFPDEAASWKAKLAGPNPQLIIQELVNIISQVPISIFSPEQQTQIQSVMQNAIAASGSQSPAPSMGAGRPNPTSAPPTPGATEQPRNTSPGAVSGSFVPGE